MSGRSAVVLDSAETGQLVRTLHHRRSVTQPESPNPAQAQLDSFERRGTYVRDDPSARADQRLIEYLVARANRLVETFEDA